MSDINEIIVDLKSEARFDSFGHFTLDKQKAREKMKKYQLIDPSYYVLEIIQAAVASGATAIDIYMDSDDCIISFDGKDYKKRELDNIYSSLFVSQKDLTLERFRELAIGINSAQALNPKFIKILSGDGSKAHQLIIKPPNFEEIVESEEVIKGTKIHVKDRVSFRVASKFFKSMTSRLPAEGQIIKEKCIYCRVPIKINKEILHHQSGMSPDEVLCWTPFENGNIRGTMGIPLSPYELSHLKFVKWGVLITTRHIRLSFLPIVGVIEADHLIKNVSQSDIVENEIYKDIITKVRSSIDQLIIALAKEYPKFNPEADYAKIARSKDILLDVIESRFRVNSFDEESPDVIKELSKVDIFETTDKKFISLETLAEQFQKIGYLAYSRKYFNEPHPNELNVLYIGDEKQVNFFDKIFAYKIKNVEQDFYQVYIRQSNKKKWEASKVDKIILISDSIVSSNFNKEEIAGEIGLAKREPDNVSRISYFLEKGLMAEKHIKIEGGLFFDAVVNNDSFKPVYTWNDIVVDHQFKKSINIILSHLCQLYLDLAKNFRKIEPPDYSHYSINQSEKEKFFDICRLHIVSYINFILGPDINEKTKESDKKTNNDIRKIFLKQTFSGEGKSQRSNNFESIEIQGIKGNLSEDFKDLSIFKTVRGNVVSLRDLESEIEENLKIPYVTKEMIGPQLYEGSIIIATSKEEEVLQKYFGWYKIENHEKALMGERNAMQHLSRPTEKPQVNEDSIEKSLFNIDGVTGEVALLSSLAIENINNNISRTMASKKTITASILKYNRFVTLRSVNIPVQNIKVSVNYNDLTVNNAWNSVSQDKQWNKLVEVIKKSLGSLIDKIIKNYKIYNSADKNIAKEFMLQYAALFIGRMDYVKIEDLKKPVLSRLMEIPLFIDIHNNPISFNDIYKNRKKHKKIAYVQRSLKEAPIKDRVILVASANEINILNQIFGYNNLENIEKEIKTIIVSDNIKKTKPEEKPQVDNKIVLWKNSFNNIDGITGEIGLIKSEYVTKKNFSSIRLLKYNRFITIKFIPLGVQLQGCFNYDKINVNDNWNNVIEDENFTELTNFIKKQIPDLFQLLLQNYPTLEGQDKIDADEYIIAYLMSSFPRFMDIKNKPQDSLEGKLSRIPVFSVLGGKKITTLEVIDYFIKHNKIDYLLSDTNQEIIDKDKFILILNKNLLNHINRLFSRLNDYSEELQQEQIALKNMSKPPVESLAIKEDFLVKITINEGGIYGDIALPLNLKSNNTITFTKSMVPVVSKLLYPRSSTFGILNCDNFNTNKLFTDIILSIEQRNIILKGIYKLYSNLINKFSQLEKNVQYEVARRFILNFYYEQKQYVASDYRIIDENLENKMCHIPLIPMHDGRLISVNAIRNQTDRLGYIPYINAKDKIQVEPEDIVLKFDNYSFDFEFCRRMVGKKRLVHLSFVKHIKKDKIQKSVSSSKKELVSNTTLPLPIKENTKSLPKLNPRTQGRLRTNKKLPYSAHNESFQENLPPDKKLLFSIKKEFRIIKERGDYKLSENILRGVQVIAVDDQPSVVFKNNQLYINIKEPFVRSVMNSIENSPHVIYYLLSIIYSTINKELLEITDEDEMKFQMVMLDSLLNHPALNSN